MWVHSGPLPYGANIVASTPVRVATASYKRGYGDITALIRREAVLTSLSTAAEGDENVDPLLSIVAISLLLLAQRPITLVLIMINSCSYILLIILYLYSFSY